jgi:hypothetical protein
VWAWTVNIGHSRYWCYWLVFSYGVSIRYSKVEVWIKIFELYRINHCCLHSSTITFLPHAFSRALLGIGHYLWRGGAGGGGTEEKRVA